MESKLDPPVQKSGDRSRHHHKSHAQRKTLTKKRLTEAGVFLVMLLIFYLFLRYITQERPPGETEGSQPAVPNQTYTTA